jgi:hypothetical protein
LRQGPWACPGHNDPSTGEYHKSHLKRDKKEKKKKKSLRIDTQHNHKEKDSNIEGILHFHLIPS